MTYTFKTFLHIALVPIIFSFFISTAFAQSSANNDVEIRQTRISSISKSIADGSVDLSEARGALRLIRNEARSAIESLTKQKEELIARIEELGAIPDDGRAEAADVTSRRQSLNSQLADIDTAIAQARLNEVDANRQLNDVLKSQRSSFLSGVLTPSRSAFAPALWNDIGQSISSAHQKFFSHFSQWKTSRLKLGTLYAEKYRVLGLLIIFLPIVALFRLWARKFGIKKLYSSAPTSLHRYSSLAFQIILNIVPIVIGLGLIYQALISTDFVNTNYQPALRITIWSILLVSTSNAVAAGLFNTGNSAWRIIPLSDKSSKTAHKISILSVSLISLGWTVTSISKINPELTHITSAASIFISLVLSWLIFVAAMKTEWRLMPERAEEISPAAIKRWSTLKKVAPPVIVLIIAALLLGYLNLAYFIVVRVVLFIGLLLGVWLIRKYLITSINTIDQNISSKISSAKSSSRQAMLFWAGIFIDGFILVSLIPILLLALGADTYSVRTGMLDAFTGITIGKFTISIADILGAMVIFFVILFVTRFLQRTLDIRLFEKSGADIGFRNSFRTLLGYLGLIIAIFAAVGVVGLDLSNLAIIAGALSVGIGFGLQSIVNNFVSGLILLFERPVKVGDWVVTTSGEGVVKQISVRSTEIETFDRASIIVPNSELISSSVTNWTHKNKIGRVVIPIGIAYGSDAKHVRQLLLDTASKHPRVLKSPAPFVYFKEFGDSSLDLELRVFIQNVSDGVLIKNDLRFDILDVFRTEKIEIPYPQRDVNLIKS